MKAIRFHQYGDADVLRYEDVEVPTPGSDQVRIRVAGTTFNGVDGNIRAGNMQGPMPLTLPHTPGVDVAGTVDALGADVRGLQVGDTVIGFLPFVADGASADFVLADADGLTAAPTSIPLADAAALPVVALTAWQALFEHAKLRSGQRILVNGASGAVGGYAVQLAKATGAHVIATGSARNTEHLLARGADEVIDHTDTQVTSAVTESVDVLLNLAPITPEEFAALTTLVADGGVVVNTTVWMPAPSDEARGVRGIDLYLRNDPQQLSELVARVDRGELAVDIAERGALKDLASVHARAAAGTLTGKIVIVPVGDED
jgi:NADPH:quinone reductase-like Zn-dependent oxidoreductase